MLYILILIEIIHILFVEKTTYKYIVFSYSLNPKYTMSISISLIRSPFFSLCLQILQTYNYVVIVYYIEQTTAVCIDKI